MVTNVTNNSPQSYAGGGEYAINGGVLSLVTTAGLLGFGATQTATATIGAQAGQFSITLDSSILSGLAGNYVYNLNITNETTNRFLINFNLSGTSRSATALFNGTNTVITARVTGGAVVLRSSITVNVTLVGNPYGLPTNSTQTIPLTNVGAGQICYLAGTLIETTSGQKPVEQIQEGDNVYVLEGGNRVTRRIVWTGTKRVNARSEAERPIRIKRDALSDGVPFDDLLVTPDHCLYLNDYLIPARMLVNGKTIVIDDQTDFDIFHIETEKHSIMLANGAPSESYLDTGNRHVIESDGNVVFPNFGAKRWDRDAAAPLGTARHVAEPIHRMLSERAAVQEYRARTSIMQGSIEPSLDLVTDSGAACTKLRRTDTHVVFHIPPGQERVWLVSPTARPSDMIGPYVDDRRNLGVLVGGIYAFCDTNYDEDHGYASDSSLAGWNDCEHAQLRWTAGEAEIPLCEALFDHGGVLAIAIVEYGPYFAVEEEQRFKRTA